MSFSIVALSRYLLRFINSYIVCANASQLQYFLFSYESTNINRYDENSYVELFCALDYST